MKPITLSIDEYIGKDLRKYGIPKEQETIEKLKKSLAKYNSDIVEKQDRKESEEAQKSTLTDFFKEVWGHTTVIDRDDMDLSLWEGNTLRVIVETKLPTSNEMISDTNFDNTAFWKPLFYYMEQTEKGQSTIGTVIVSDFKQLYLFDADKIFLNLAKKASVKNAFKAHRNDKSGFYAKMTALNLTDEIPACKINLDAPDLDLELLYRLLDKPSLFHLAPPNDANSINPQFYNELLYIMGLKEDAKASLVYSGIKNTLLDLTQEIVKNKTPKANNFETALSLIILWLNRILFLKLLESQLKTVRNDEDFAFLNPEDAADPNALYNLFFNVLNKPRKERSLEDQKAYRYIPYLNSSLFVPASIEEKYDISSINGKRKIKVQGGSILGAKYAHKEMPLLEYLLRFLNCYQFNRENEGSNPDTIIKSSVLGLVFERLNGYADGAVFTPASITMYMCKTIIQRQTVKAFNEAFGIECSSMEELTAYADKNFYKEDNRNKALAVIDGITIIDPAVGSGHFLVSALNELIRIKSHLGLLHKGLEADIENDELIIRSHDKPFTYQIENGKLTSRQQEIQRLIFDTKKHIIENQLFGVDINPNSVNICRLRLWIELLKHSYFTDDELIDMEALPNLEFKVITANSLISVPDMPLYFNKEKQAKLRAEMHRYYNATLGAKEAVKAEVSALIAEVKKDSQLTILENYNPFDTQVSTPFFDSGLMFGIEHFDICIGNPPYVPMDKINKAIKPIYKKTFSYNDDLYTYFYLRAFDFIHAKGIMGYITSNTFLTLYSKEKLRTFLQGKHILKIRLVPNIFDKVAVEPLILIAEHQKDNYTFTYADDRFQPLDSPENAYEVSIDTFRNSPNQVFFTPNPHNLALAKKYFPVISPLLERYWALIENSGNIVKYKGQLDAYRKSLKAGDITLLGLITEGGQGLATANNGYFIGVKEGTKDAQRTHANRLKKMAEFNREQGTSYDISTMPESEIRTLFTRLKSEHGRDVFGKGFLYQIVGTHEIADVSTLTEEEKANGISPNTGKTFVPYDKGDRDGNRWYMPTVYAINWSKENVDWLKSDPKARWQGYDFFFREGLTWTLLLNPSSIGIKARMKAQTVFDVNAMTIFTIYKNLSNKYLAVLLNSFLIFTFMRSFLNNTAGIQMNDARQLPIIIPSPAQLKEAEELFNRAKAIKDKQIAGELSESQADELLAPIQAEVDAFVEGIYGVDKEF